MDKSLKKARDAFEREEKLFRDAQEAYDQAQRDFNDEGKDISLADAEQAYKEAVARYERACQDYIPFRTEDKILAPPLMRAAYSDRMAWILANMAKMAYIRFDMANKENREDELARLKFCLQSGRYDYDKQIRSTLKKEQAFELVAVFDTSEGREKGTKKTDTQAFLAVSDAFAVLSFRGTQIDNWTDVWTDLMAVRRTTKDGRVHAGFLEAFDEVTDDIKKVLPEIGDLPLYITGHSLGAALATVATGEYEHIYEDQIAACYTFGSPLVGDGVYERSIKVPFYRLANPTDIVTLIPKFLWAYVHVGDVRYLSRKPELYRGMPVLFRAWEALLEMLSALIRLNNPFSPWISEHSMDLYIKKLELIAISRQHMPRENPQKAGQLWR